MMAQAGLKKLVVTSSGKVGDVPRVVEKWRIVAVVGKDKGKSLVDLPDLPEVVSKVGESESIDDIRNKLAKSTAVIVVDSEDKPVGIVTAVDLGKIRYRQAL
jgi:predicted transcriptional regulator